ncbi:hypothetical protein W04_3082 [Pseudoalteromonas sp. SW0106-04]|nr:hypothetical protein W04_3082 [Pseudoalteromonas sp. SW0106-04]
MRGASSNACFVVEGNLLVHNTIILLGDNLYKLNNLATSTNLGK